ncbi:MAG TPA: D-ribose pyranase [Thermomicrobiales bacterium]|nr:D-ribose pyranase [Thermomicrobiales bacterium]
MKKTRLLNHALSDVIARIGHTQCLVIADAGLPIPFHVQRIDLSIVPGLPTVRQLAEAIAEEMEVEAIVVADELLAWDTTLANDMAALFDAPYSAVPHTEFKRRSENAIAVVRSGDTTPYYNVMLISGVNY